MRRPIDWVKRVMGPAQPGVLALFTPPVAGESSRVLRFALGAATMSVMGTAAVVGIAAFAALMMAMGVIYFLATQVLGLKVSIDPRAMYEQVQRQAAQASHAAN